MTCSRLPWRTNSPIVNTSSEYDGRHRDSVNQHLTYYFVHLIQISGSIRLRRTSGAPNDLGLRGGPNLQELDLE
jgi:hypothetical protein